MTHTSMKKINSKIKFSSDFIIGYPGETKEDFRDTLNFLNQIKFINSYSFIFSPRPGTTASNYKQIDEKLSKKRLKQLQTLLFDNQKLKNKSFENKYLLYIPEQLDIITSRQKYKDCLFRLYALYTCEMLASQIFTDWICVFRKNEFSFQHLLTVPALSTMGSNFCLS